MSLSLTAILLQANERPDYVCEDCNVIVVSIDTLRADHLGCYGYPLETTPHIDRFAEESVRFATAIAQAPSTEPSHASIFTSMIPAHHGGLRARHQPISKNVVTMAEILRSAGFRTVSFNGGGQVAATYGFDRGFELYESAADNFSEKVKSGMSWIARNPNERFFMFLHTYQVHAPYTPEPEELSLFDEGYHGKLPAHITPGLLIDINQGELALTQSDVAHIIAAYDGGIRSVDHAFGRFVDYLRKRRLLDKTLFVFTSDHGEEFGEHGQMGRHSHALYDELLKVPFILRLPGARFGSTVVEQQVRGIDVLPTVIEILGLDPMEQFEGRSLMNLVMQKEDAERIAISQLDTADQRPPSSIRTESEKLILGTHALVDEPGYKWFERTADIVSESHNLNLAIESFHKPRRVSIQVDGKFRRRLVISTRRKQIVSIPFSTAERRIITIRSMMPCTPPAEVGVDIDMPCISFRIFNPFEYFLLDEDAGEQENLYADEAYADPIAALERQLLATIAGDVATGEPIELDEQTRERLKSLGYVD